MSENQYPMNFSEHEIGRKLDHLLEDFYHSEMPNPWPTLQLPISKTKPRKSLSSIPTSRWALAASLLLLISGYLVLAPRFPQSTSSPLPLPQNGWIGSREVINPPPMVPSMDGKIAPLKSTPDSRRMKNR